MSQKVMNELVDMSQEIIKLKDQRWELLSSLKKIKAAVSNADSLRELRQGLAMQTVCAAIAKAEGEKA